MFLKDYKLATYLLDLHCMLAKSQRVCDIN